MQCPFCKRELEGEDGSKQCPSQVCGAYQTNEDNYGLTRKERVDLPNEKNKKKQVKLQMFGLKDPVEKKVDDVWKD